MWQRLLELTRIAVQPYRNYGRFAGRARRRDYALFIAFQWLVISAIVGVHWVLTGGRPLPDPTAGLSGNALDRIGVAAIVLFVAISLLPWLTISTRRLHDRGLRGWVMARWFLPYVGVLFMLWDLFAPGDFGDNQFGPNPRWMPADDWFE